MAENSRNKYMENKDNEIHLVSAEIERAAAAGSVFLCISSMLLTHLPDSLLQLAFIKYFYASDNQLKILPTNFFSCLPNLKWLDLRFNCLTQLPVVDLSDHAFLEYILLEENSISQLPIELGDVKSLRSLSLSGNPIEFPDADVIADGIHSIKRFLRHYRGNRSPYCSESCVSEPSEQVNESHREINSLLPRLTTLGDNRKIDMLQLQQQQAARTELHASRKHVPVKQSERHSMFVSTNPEPPPIDRIERRVDDERRQEKRRAMLNRQEAVLQRRRDVETTQKWRDETRRMQAAKIREQLAKGPLSVQRESVARVQAAPFNSGWENDLLHLPTSDERELHKWQGEVPAQPKPEPLTHEQLRYIEQQRRHQEAKFTDQVHQHAAAIHERSKLAGQMPPSDEVQAAKRDVEIALAMQRELAKRRAELEFRASAFNHEQFGSAERQKRRSGLGKS